MINTYKFAHISDLAYQDNPKLAGYEVASIEDVETDTQVFIFYDDNVQIVAFRGTAPSMKSIEDLKTDLNIKMVNGTHAGFMKAYNSVAQIITDALSHRKLTVYTGHSLGGALAIIACSMDTVSRSKICMTFGAPRVFNAEQAKVYDELNGHITFRIESKGDPVPFMPPYSCGYRHVGKCCYLDGKIMNFDDCTVDAFLSMLFSRATRKLQAHSIMNYKNQLKKVYLND